MRVSNLSIEKNSAGASVVTVEGTDLSVAKTHWPEPVVVCTPLVYTLTVANHGPAVATGVTLIDQLPPAADILSVHASQGECCYPWKGCCHPPKECCPPAGGCGWVCQTVREVVCRLGSLPVGGQATVEIVVRPKTPGPLANTAMVVANQKDTVPGNNQATDTADVICPAAQMEILIARIGDLASAGTVGSQDADLLAGGLERAKWAYECGSIRDAHQALDCFLQTVERLVVQGAMPRDEGCALSKSAALTRESCCCYPGTLGMPGA